MEFTPTKPMKIPEVFPMMSTEAHKLVEKMLQLDPNQRPTAQEVLEHPYFTEEEPKPCHPSELPIKSMLNK